MRTESENVDAAAVVERPRRSGAWLILGMLLGVAVSGIVVLALGGRALVNLFSGSGNNTTVKVSTVVRSIQELQRLETVRYTIDQVVTEEHEGMLPQPWAGEKILLIAHGEVIAGVDLGQLSGNAVTVSGNSVRVRLPDARILTTRVDNQKTRVYSRDTGLFSAPDPQLETRVRQQAESQLTQAALRDGILLTARDNARHTLSALLHSLGFTQVTVE